MKLFVTGPGISAELIPPFNNSLEGVDHFELEKLGRILLIRKEKFKELKPTPAHLDIAARIGDGLVLTQNIDGLHEKSGIAPNRVLHVEGCYDFTLNSRYLLGDWDDLAKVTEVEMIGVTDDRNLQTYLRKTKVWSDK